jgi:uncharacterized Tic20 family protein
MELARCRALGYAIGMSTETSDRMWAAGCHLASFLGFLPFGHLLGPAAVWLFKRRKIKLVDEQGKQSLNFQLSMTLYMLAVAILTTLGLPSIFLHLLGTAALVAIMLAVVKTMRGEHFRYPGAIRFIR